MRVRGACACAVAVMVVLIARAAAAQADGDPPLRQVNVGTAAFSGVYHQVGAALCRKMASSRSTAHRQMHSTPMFRYPHSGRKYSELAD